MNEVIYIFHAASTTTMSMQWKEWEKKALRDEKRGFESKYYRHLPIIIGINRRCD